MTEVLLCGAAFLLFAAQAFTDKNSSRITKSQNSVYLFGVIKCGIATLISLVTFLLATGGNTAIGLGGILISVMTGVGQGVCTILIVVTLKRASLIQMNLFMSAGVIIPAVLSAIFYGEELKPEKIIGIVVFFVATAFLMGIKSPKDFLVQKDNLLLLFLVFLFYGILMFGQKSFPKIEPSGSVAFFSLIMYFTATVIIGSVLLFGIFRGRKREGEKEPKVPIYRLFLWGILAAGIVFGLNTVITTLSAVLPAYLVFPLTGGAKTVIVALVSTFFYKEKWRPTFAVGFVLFILSIVLLSI